MPKLAEPTWIGDSGWGVVAAISIGVTVLLALATYAVRLGDAAHGERGGRCRGRRGEIDRRHGVVVIGRVGHGPIRRDRNSERTIRHGDIPLEDGRSGLQTDGS